MARRRFFVSEVRGGRAELVDDDAEHLTRVLRVEAGEQYEISDNQRVYLAEVSTARKRLVVFDILEELAADEPTVQLTLMPALIKFDHLEWMFEKATELGVTRIVPVECGRSEHGLERAALKRHARWERIVLESSQQARRTRLPVVDPVISFQAAIRQQADFRVFLDEDQGPPPLWSVLPEYRKSTDHVAILLGPEGGWVDHERADALHALWQPVTLGKQILRAETAAISALAILQQAWLLSEPRKP